MLATANDWVKVVPNERGHDEGIDLAGHRNLSVPVGRFARWRWATSICPPSPSATNCCGGLLSRFAVCLILLDARTMFRVRCAGTVSAKTRPVLPGVFDGDGIRSAQRVQEAWD